MKNHLVLSVCVVFLTSVVSSLSAAEDKTGGNPEFTRLKSTYEKEMQKIDDSGLEIIVTAQEKYTAAVTGIKKQAQQAGKLELVLALDKEIERFAAQKRIDEENISKELPDLASAQSSYIRALQGLPVAKAGKVVALVQNYEKALANLQETLTRNNDIRSAVEVKNEKDRLANVPELMSARAVLADAEAKAAVDKVAGKAAEKEPVKVAAAEDAPVKAVVKNEPVKKKYTGSPEKRVRQRFDELCKSLLKQDFTKASELVDPELVKKLGADGVRRGLVETFPFLQLADDPHRKLSVDSVKLGDDKLTATLVPKLWAGNQWHDLPSNKWIESDGDWYIAENADDQRMIRHEMKHDLKDIVDPNGPRGGGGPKPFRRMGR